MRGNSSMREQQHRTGTPGQVHSQHTTHGWVAVRVHAFIRPPASFLALFPLSDLFVHPAVIFFLLPAVVATSRMPTTATAPTSQHLGGSGTAAAVVTLMFCSHIGIMHSAAASQLLLCRPHRTPTIATAPTSQQLVCTLWAGARQQLVLTS